VEYTKWKGDLVLKLTLIDENPAGWRVFIEKNGHDSKNR